MRLSSALVIVFILHLIAGGGLWAFSNFKEKHGEEAVQRDVRERLQTASADPAGPAPGPVPTGLAPKPAAMVSSVAKPAADAGPMPKDSGEIYVVKKGDNPVKIAKRQNVSYDDLMRLNQLDDARYLQIGQKLRLPARRHEAKTEHE